MRPAEMQLRREKGLCYWCDDKFTFNHKCPNRNLMLLEWDDSTEATIPISESGSIPMMGNDTDFLPDGNPTEHHLSLNALRGVQGMCTIRFKANIMGLDIQVLIDGGSSDNFLQPRIAKFLKLAIEPAPLLKVMVGNGNHMTAEGKVQDLQFNVQGHTFNVPVY